jgi:Tfp pilus assembly protein PilX
MLVVLLLLSVMLLGGMALARLSEVGTLASGNAAFHDAALQASEVGVNTAFAAVRALANEEANAGSWYSATALAKDADGLPSGVNWTNAPELVVGVMSVRYVVERACGVTPVTNALRECLVKHIPQTESNSSDKEKLDPPNSKQFRITVRVVGPKGTETFVQSLVTKGVS